MAAAGSIGLHRPEMDSSIDDVHSEDGMDTMDASIASMGIHGRLGSSMLGQSIHRTVCTRSESPESFQSAQEHSDCDPVECNDSPRSNISSPAPEMPCAPRWKPKPAPPLDVMDGALMGFSIPVRKGRLLPREQLGRPMPLPPSGVMLGAHLDFGLDTPTELPEGPGALLSLFDDDL
eukprot:Hpha_TRINITY_DN15811_c2_g1::TRINITY_DN15811_c2_g1_i3::g.187526::m.187526